MMPSKNKTCVEFLQPLKSEAKYELSKKSSTAPIKRKSEAMKCVS